MDGALIDALLAEMVQSVDAASDLLFMEGKPPLVDVDGRLEEFPIDTPGSQLTADLIAKITDHILAGEERLLATLESTGSCDTSYGVKDVARFRVNIYKQKGQRAIAMRKFPSEIPTLEKLALPPVFGEMVKEKNGIILITGAAGSGKTTTLAALIDRLNQTQNIHILTLEDPVEFVHLQGCAAISQRELGRDFFSFAEGLRVGLRQAPKVILLGEIRDRETMEIAMNASETGHLVFSTLHTISAGQTINRILGFFRSEEQEQVRYRLCDSLRYTVSQRLVHKIGGGRLLITEIIGNSLRTRESIRYGESEGKTFHEIIEAASTLGWHSFDQSLLQARTADLINDETAITFSTNKSSMRLSLDLLHKKRGTKEAEVPSGLKLERAPAGGQNRVIRPRSVPEAAASRTYPEKAAAPPIAGPISS